MKIFLKIAGLILIIGIIASLIPVFALYLQKDVTGPTNDQIVEKLKDNKGNVFAFIVFGDNHAGFIFDDSAFLKIIRNMNRENRFRKLNMDFVVNLGDIAFIKGTKWDYRIYNRLRAKIKWPVISLMGNHDDDRHGEHLFREYLGKKEFSFVN
ncbi:MAG: metallophosphoesterase, partial [Candidatus Omnitrophota bacterium]